MDSSYDQALSEAVQQLDSQGLRSAWYLLPGMTAFTTITGSKSDNVYCLEAYLGPCHARPDYDSYAVAELFHPRYQSMALIFMRERRRSDGQHSEDMPTYNIKIDNRFSRMFLPVMHTAFNKLDPTGKQRGLLVQSYNAKLTLGDFPQATIMTVELILRFKRDGQLAQIAVDFSDPFITSIANLMTPVIALVGGDIHYLPRRSSASTLRFPVRQNDSCRVIGENSIALDEGIQIACAYFDRHYTSHLNNKV